MTQLTRSQAKSALSAAGWPSNLLDTMVAIGAAESRLEVDVTGGPNPDGTFDYGWLQINSSHGYDKARLLSDATYTAQCGLNVYHGQGLGAWATYTGGEYKRFMPPPVGANLAQGSPVWFLVADLQTALNRWLTSIGQPTIAVDGDFGPQTEGAVQAYQKAHPVEPGVVGPVYGHLLALW